MLNKESKKNFLISFYNSCKNIVEFWRENEKELLTKYNEEENKDCFIKLMNEETNLFSELIALHNEFVKTIKNVYSFKKYYEWQKNFSNKDDFAKELFLYQFFPTKGNKEGIDFPVFSDEQQDKIRLNGNEFLRIMREYDAMPTDLEQFFNRYCLFLIQRWYNTQELHAEERQKRVNRIKRIKTILENEDFKNLKNKKYCLSILNIKKSKRELIDLYVQRYNKIPENALSLSAISEIKRVTMEEKIYERNEELRELIIEIQDILNIWRPDNLDRPINEDKTLTLIDTIKEVKDDSDKLIDNLNKTLDKYIHFVEMSNRDQNKDQNKLNEIARGLIRLVFSGKYNLTKYVDEVIEGQYIRGIDSLEEELKTTFEKKYPKEYTAFKTDERHRICEIIHRRLDSFKTKLNARNNNIPLDDLEKLCTSIDVIKQSLPHKKK